MMRMGKRESAFYDDARFGKRSEYLNFLKVRKVDNLILLEFTFGVIWMTNNGNDIYLMSA